MAADSSLELLWISVGAGTRFQAASLAVYERLAAFAGRRPRRTLVHAGLKGVLDGEPFALEMAPEFECPEVPGELTGPVGARWAGRWKLFRYQVHLQWGNSARLPDEAWAVAPAVRLSEDRHVVQRVLEAAQGSPAYVWGRRRGGHPEMWTSNSTVAWALAEAGIAAAAIAVPDGCRAPGWSSGLAEARRRSDAKLDSQRLSAL